MGAQAVRLSNVDIDNALKNKDFEVLFQPIFDLGNGALARVETFVRWRHPSLGVLPPGAFISFFESQGRMSELTRYVLGEALAQYLNWRGPSAPGFSINLALSDLADEAFASHFVVLLRDSGFPTDLVTLECPMPPVTMDVDTASAHFQRLSSTGARLAIEVRGRANDFLRDVDPFPFDEIKTGGAAILRFARTVRGPGLSAISELLEIAQNANAAITAVGVEDQASLSALRGLGFAAAQGNHLGKVGDLAHFTPSRVNEVRELLGLEPLSSEDLQALFRTEAPAPKVAPKTGAADPAQAAPAAGEDQLVERLAARLARSEQQEAAEETGSAATDAAERQAKLAEVRRRRAVKAAALARAKKQAKEATARQEQAEADARAESDAHAARQLQERLSKEFESAAADEFHFKDEDAAAAADETPQSGAAPAENGAEEAAAFAPQAEEAPAAADGAADETGREAAMTAAPADDPQDIEAEAAMEAEPVEDAAAAHAADAEPDQQPVQEAEEVADAPAVAAAAGAGAAPNAASDAFSPSNIRTSLAVKAARAHFRPGLRIGVAHPIPPAPQAPAKAPEPTTSQPAAGDAPQPPDTAAFAGEASAAPETHETATAETAAPESAPASDAGYAEPGQHGDLHEEADTEEAPVAAEDPAPRRKKKNFLTRKYDIRLPNHFWPRSWKRAWQRRAQENAARRAEREAAAEEDASA